MLAADFNAGVFDVEVVEVLLGLQQLLLAAAFKATVFLRLACL